MNTEIVIRRALTDRQFEIAKALLALPVDEADLWRAMAAIVSCGINNRARDGAHADGLAGEYCVQFLDLVKNGRDGAYLIYENPVVINFPASRLLTGGADTGLEAGGEASQ